eukprot:6480030-Amphidinium_carterae.1
MDEVNHIRLPSLCKPLEVHGEAKLLVQPRRVIQRRAEMGRRSGGVLLSRKMIETLPEMDELKNELLDILVAGASRVVGCWDDWNAGHHACSVIHASVPLHVIGAACCVFASPVVFTKKCSLTSLWASSWYADISVPAEIHFAPRFHHFELMSSPLLPTQFDCTFGYTLGCAATQAFPESHNDEQFFLCVAQRVVLSAEVLASSASTLPPLSNTSTQVQN